MLLNEKRVDEALQLAHVAMETLSGTERDEKVSWRIHEMCKIYASWF